MSVAKTVRVSEARLNDMVYLALKKIFFEPIQGEGSCPRECDIRVCMDIAVPERIKSIQQAILLPNEVAGKSHTIFYEVEPDHVLSVVIDYMEDHWMKQTVEEASGDPNVRTKLTEFFNQMVEALMQLPEEQCGGPTEEVS